MFDKDRFIQDCVNGVAEGQAAIRELVKEAVSDGARVMSQLGAPEHAGIVPIFRSRDLTIINFVWAPYMSLMPHDHQMFSVVGIYSGREDNVLWRKTETGIEAAGARSLGVGEVAALGRDAIHSVLNPIGKMSCALHVYGGDFFSPDEPRSQWNHETLARGPWDIGKVKSLFQDAEARFESQRRMVDAQMG